MLTPEYLDQVTDDILAMYDALNESIVEDIARRIVKTGEVTETAAWQAKQMQEMGALYDDILQRVAEVSGYTQKELKTLFEEAGVENIRYENDIMSQAGLMPIQLKQSESMLKLLKAGLDKTNRDLSNLTLTTALKAQSAYYDATNLAYMQVSSGVLSPQEAIKRAIVSTAKEGASVLYPSGYSDKIDVAVRRAVLTGVNQTAAKMSEQFCKETGCDYVETTAHSGARPEHEAWQGQVFCISGKDKKYRPFSDTGYGSGAGLCGWNCRHSFHAFWPGISVPTYTQEMLEDYKAKKYEYDGQELTDYECSQRQRSMERSIRETKRQLTACDAAIKATDDEVLKAQLQSEFESKAVRLKGQEAAMKDFTRKTDRRIDSSRVQVNAVRDGSGKIVGFNKSVSQKAVVKADKHYKEWAKSVGAETGPKNLAGYYALKYNESKESRLFSGYVNAVKAGRVSPLVGYDEFKAVAQDAESLLVGMRTSDGEDVKGITAHFIDRVIGQQSPDSNPRKGIRNGVALADIEDALKNPYDIGPIVEGKNGKRSKLYYGKNASVSYNPDTGELIQTQPKRSK